MMNPEVDTQSLSQRSQRLRQVLKKVLDSATDKISDKAIRKVYDDIIQMTTAKGTTTSSFTQEFLSSLIKGQLIPKFISTTEQEFEVLCTEKDIDNKLSILESIMEEYEQMVGKKNRHIKNSNQTKAANVHNENISENTINNDKNDQNENIEVPSDMESNSNVESSMVMEDLPEEKSKYSPLDILMAARMKIKEEEKERLLQLLKLEEEECTQKEQELSNLTIRLHNAVESVASYQQEVERAALIANTKN